MELGLGALALTLARPSPQPIPKLIPKPAPNPNQVSSVNMTLLNRIFVAAQRNGACRNFALPALKPGAKPNAAALNALPELPKDDRASEVTAALAFTLSFGGLLLLEALDVLDFILPG